MSLAFQAGFEDLYAVKGMLPKKLRRLRVGHGKVDLRFEREKTGMIQVRVLQREGDVDVVIEPSARVAK